MSVCIICKQEITPKQSKRITGLGPMHLFCYIGKVVKPADHLPNAKKSKPSE